MRWYTIALCYLIALCGFALLAASTKPPAAPQSPEIAQILLGRYLFYDRRLSVGGQTSCASCHQQRYGFGDNLAVPQQSADAPIQRNTISLLNLSERSTFGWADPRVSLEEQIAQPLLAQHEMGGSDHAEPLLAWLRSDAEYQARFAAAYPASAEPISWEHTIQALAAFSQSLVAHNSPYDNYVNLKDPAALSESALRGMTLFFSPSLACAHCHSDIQRPDAREPANQSQQYLANGAGQSADTGLGDYRFRVPTLRNLRFTAPYMHDGSLATLEDVIRFYESGGTLGAGQEPGRQQARHALIAGFQLSDSERSDLIAFLEALSDPSALSNPAYSNPFE